MAARAPLALLVVIAGIACTRPPPEAQPSTPRAASTAQGASPSQAIASAASVDSHEEVRHIGSGIKPPEVIRRVLPDFAELHSQTWRGACIVEAIIGEDGHVREVRNLTPGRAERDRLLAEAVQKWRFTPALEDGRPVAVYFVMSVNHCLE